MQARIDPEAAPVTQGQRKALSLAVTNPGQRLLVLDEARGDGPNDERLRWRRPPDGVVIFDAGKDEYRLHSVVAARALVPLCHGVVQPGETLRTFLPVKSLEAGRRRVRVTITGHLVPLDDVTLRVYASPERVQGAVTTFERIDEPRQAHGAVIVRLGGGVEPTEATAEVELEVAEDRDAPPALALERAGPGATLVDRVRRLGGAWVARAQDGATVVADARRALRLAPGVVPDARLWSRLDETPPSAPSLVMFLSDAARALRDGGTIPLDGLDRAQHLVSNAALWDLLRACDERRLTVRFGRHSGMTDGLIVT